LIEHYAGAMPPWLAPRQAVVVPVAPAFEEYAVAVSARLKAAGVRVFADIDNDRMNAKIRKYQGQKIPYQLVVGQKEMDEDAVAVRTRDGSQKVMSVESFIQLLLEKTSSKSAELL